jgi:hypothetical protein
MITSLNLYKREQDRIYAHLTEDKVVIYDEKLTRFLRSGITFPSSWVKEFGFEKKSKIYQGENDRQFAKAFLEEYFVHGLMQLGYHWKDQDGRDVVIWDSKQRKIVGTIEAIFSKEITQITDKIASMDINEEKSPD